MRQIKRREVEGRQQLPPSNARAAAAPTADALLNNFNFERAGRCTKSCVKPPHTRTFCAKPGGKSLATRGCRSNPRSRLGRVVTTANSSVKAWCAVEFKTASVGSGSGRVVGEGHDEAVLL